MNLMWKKSIRGAILASIGATVPLTAYSAEPGFQSGTRLDIGFHVEGGDINTQPPSPPGSGDPFHDGNIISATDVLNELHAAPTINQQQSLFKNATLLVSAESDDGKISTREKIAFCHQLDLYSEPSTANLMKADCDGAIFQYVIDEHGISLQRNAEEVATLRLDGGLYLINGEIRKILALP